MHEPKARHYVGIHFVHVCCALRNAFSSTSECKHARGRACQKHRDNNVESKVRVKFMQS